MRGQGSFEFKTWGGKRKGAGRKPAKAGLRHRRVRRRPRLSGREPLHVVVRVVPEVGRLRRRKAYQAIRRALLTVLAKGRMRVVHLSIQRTHIHLIVEAGDERALARGMQGFQISAARHLNAAVTLERSGTWRGHRGGGNGGTTRRRRGQVFTDRYHAEILDTPRRARHALAYVLRGSIKRRIDAGSGSGDHGLWISRHRTDPARFIDALAAIPSLGSRQIARTNWTACAAVPRWCSKGATRRETSSASSTAWT